MSTEGMIRSPRKVQAVINNARCYQRVREEYGSFCDYIWGFSGGKTILYQGHDKGAIPVSNGLSDRISKDLKKRGFMYVGAVTILCYPSEEYMNRLNPMPRGVRMKARRLLGNCLITR